MKMIAAVIVILTSAVLLVGYYFFRYSCDAKHPAWNKAEKQPDPDTDKGKRWLHKQHLIKEAEALKYEDAWIESEDGLKLHARFYPNENAERIVICCHGFHGTGCGDFCAILPMLVRDCTVLLIDERCAGESEGKYYTYGAKEHRDILLWRRWAAQRNTAHLPVYLIGISMGAASVLLNAKYEEPKCHGIIADCGYSSMEKAIDDVSRSWFHVPSNTPLMKIYCRLFAGFSMKDTQVSESLKEAGIPVMFMHGKRDRFVLPENTDINALYCASDHEVHWFENAGHAGSSITEPERYEALIRRFFKENA